MAAAAVGRGAQTMNSVYLKPMLRRGYHRQSPDVVSDTLKINGEDMKVKSSDDNGEGNWWTRDDRTGVYYPKGQEKTMKDVPLGAGKDFGVNWFSNHENRV